jgi:hypothetical protein
VTQFLQGEDTDTDAEFDDDADLGLHWTEAFTADPKETLASMEGGFTVREKSEMWLKYESLCRVPEVCIYGILI